MRRGGFHRPREALTCCHGLRGFRRAAPRPPEPKARLRLHAPRPPSSASEPVFGPDAPGHATAPSPVARPPASPRARLLGIGLMCLAIACFAALDASAKWLGQRYDPLQVAFARYFVAVLLVSVVINPWTVPGVMRTRRPWLQAGRSLLLFGSTACNFYALQHLQLAETISIMFLTPLVVALLGGPLLGEWVGPRRMAAIGVGFLGVVVVTRPWSGGIQPAMLLTVAGMLCYALYSLATRQLAGHDSTATTLTYSALAGLVIMLPVVPGHWTTPTTPGPWLVMGLIGLLGAVGHFLLIRAHALAPAGVLAPFIYTQIVWMIALGAVLFGDWPDAATLVGSGIVIASGLYLLARERVKKPLAEPSAAPFER